MVPAAVRTSAEASRRAMVVRHPQTAPAAPGRACAPPTAPTAADAPPPGTVPVAIELPGHGAGAPVIPTATGPDGAVTVPDPPSTVGWWSPGALAGAATGTTVLVGHVDSAASGLGVFAVLRDVAVGERVLLRGADGRCIGLPGDRAAGRPARPRCPPTCSPPAGRPASRWSHAAAGSTGRPGTTPTTSSSTRSRPDRRPLRAQFAALRHPELVPALERRATSTAARDPGGTTGTGVARWNAVSTSTAVADHAETPEHAAVRVAAQRAAAAAPGVRAAGGPAVDAALRTMAAALRDRTADLLAANAADVEAAERGGMTGGLLDRLRLTPERLADMAVQLEVLADTPEPPLQSFVRTLPTGERVFERRVPVGVIGAVFEARPNVTIDVASQVLKARSAAVLRTGPPRWAARRPWSSW